MNFNDDDIEILDDPDDSSKVPSTSEQKTNHKEVISPYVPKSSVTGTTSNSPRITSNDTFVKPKEPISQQVPITTNNKNEKDVSSKEKGIRPVTLLILFIVILLAIFLLPYTEKVFKYFSSNQNDDSVIEEVTVGRLVCTLEHNDENNSYQYEEVYSFRDKKVESLEHTVIIQGNADYLNERSRECQQLQNIVDDTIDVTVTCDLSHDQMVESQYFNLVNFDFNSLTTAFIESGGIYPNVKAGDSYRSVQSSLEMTGYECKVQ